MACRDPDNVRRVIRAARLATLVLAILGFAWAGWLVLGGAADINLLGVRLRSHEPLRPFTIGCIALAAFVLLGGRLLSLSAWRPGDRIQALTLSLVVAAFGIAYSTTAATGSDPYGYVSQADLWLAGDLHIEQPGVADAPWPLKFRSFSPLGYRPPDDDGAPDGAIVPTYPSGLALLMAGAKAIGGQEAMFWIVPLSGGLLVLVTYAIGTRIAPPSVAIVATWLMASSPAMLYMLVQPMSDVPVAAAWLVACYLLVCPGIPAGAGAGLVGAVAILIRPNLVFLVAILFAWPLWRARGDRRALWQSLAFGGCASIGIVLVALINRSLYGSASEFGHGDLNALFGWSHLLPNMMRYFSWLIESHTIAAVLGLAGIAWPWRRLWPDEGQRRLLALPLSVVISVWLFYGFYLVFDEWAALRFLLPALPFIAIGTGAAVVLIRRLGGSRSTLAAIALVLVVFAQYRFAVSHGVLDFWDGERRYVGVARLVREQTDERSVIFSLHHSGSVRYYGGRMTMRFDNLERESLDQAVEWLSSRGIPSYLLAEEWEIPMFKERFAGQGTLGRLETPTAIYQFKGYPARLYDLTQAPAGGVQQVPNSIVGLRSAPPALSGGQMPNALRAQ